MSHLSHRLAEAANNINNHLNEAPKTSPQEDEFLTDLTKAQIAAISPLMKSKDWNRLKAYLMSQKIVDKNFEDIQGYRMDRDVLSVLQRSFKDYHEQVESGEGVTEGAPLTEATIEFMLDKKVVLRKTMKDVEARRAGDQWTKSGILPYQFNKTAAEKYRIPWKTPLVDGGVTHGPGYKKGQKRDAVIGAKKSFESVESGEGVTEARTNNTGTPTPVRLGKGRPAGAMTPAALFMHKFDQLENDNAHGAAALLLAKFMGQPKAVKCIELVNKIHEIEGSIPHLIQQYRDRWSERLWADFAKKYPGEKIA